MRLLLALGLLSLLMGCHEEFEPTPRSPRSDFEGLPPVARLDEGVENWRLPPLVPSEAGLEDLRRVEDAAPVADAAPVVDATPLSPDATRGCRMDRECALAWDLNTCDPCAVGATLELIELSPCMVAASIDGASPRSAPGCASSCGPGDPCFQQPFEAICFDRVCTSVGGI